MDAVVETSESASPPLVSCIMPTYGRPDYVQESVAMFLAQDYPYKELIVLNDCPEQEFHGDLPGVRVINEQTRYASLGEKRNVAIEAAAGVQNKELRPNTVRHTICAPKNNLNLACFLRDPSVV